MNSINQIKKEKTAKIEQFQYLLELLKGGDRFGIQLEGISEKINSIITNIQTEKIKVALVGGFSEGKTTVAAGWMGKVEDNMKIDPDESSDAIHLYRPEGIEEDFEVIDTPGLFGGKEFVNGDKFKEITLKYISEAHLILYVLDPVNPIKESHAETVKWLFRDLGKIDSVIFVLNKMDEVADLLDEEDFDEVVKIKKENIITSLERLIKLSPEEKEKINVVAISANPKDKGLEFWLQRTEDYNSRSRINFLREQTNFIIQKNKEELIGNSELSSIKDLILRHTKTAMPVLQNLEYEISNRKDSLNNIEEDVEGLQKKVQDIKGPLREDLITYKNELISKFGGADITTLKQYITEEIGSDGINFESRISNIVEGYMTEISGITKSIGKSIENEMDFSESLYKQHMKIIKDGAEGLKAIPLNQWHSVINTSRNFINSTFKTSIKFKPWGITKLARGAQGAAVGIGVLLEAYEIFSKARDKNEFEKAKSDTINLISETIDEQLKNINNSDTFIKTFAPKLTILEKQLVDLKTVYSSILEKKQEMENWINNVNKFSLKYSEEIGFEEVNADR